MKIRDVFAKSIALHGIPHPIVLQQTGFLINWIAKRYGLTAAVAGSSVFFALVHIPQFGVGAHLIPIFFACITYALIRISSGSLLLAVFGHWIINALIFFPKWIIAAMYFANAR